MQSSPNLVPREGLHSSVSLALGDRHERWTIRKEFFFAPKRVQNRKFGPASWALRNKTCNRELPDRRLPFNHARRVHFVQKLWSWTCVSVHWTSYFTLLVSLAVTRSSEKNLVLFLSNQRKGGKWPGPRPRPAIWVLIDGHYGRGNGESSRNLHARTC